MKTYKLIVCRYQEDISWIKNIQIPYLIYNRGNALPREYNHIEVPNIEREGYVYLSYIVDFYHQLDDITYFLQGNPFDHFPNAVQFVNSRKALIKFEPMSIFAGKLYKINTNLKMDATLNIGNQNIPFYWEEDPRLVKIYEKYLKTDFTEQSLKLGWNVPLNGQFAVCKKYILSNTKDFYLDSLRHLETGELNSWVLERFWEEIFTRNTNRKIF